MVDLPDILKKDMRGAQKNVSQEMQEALKKAETEAKKIKPEISKETAKPDEMVQNPKSATAEDSSKREKKLKNALARIKSLAKIQGAEETPDLSVVKGNKISKGTSLSGDAREAAEATYFDVIRDRLQENWALPVWLARQNLSAQVTIFIDGSGQVKGIRFDKSSGNAQFDDAVKKAIVDSVPFPRPPAGLADLLASGVPAGFPL
jgi:colicin import membrane protein